MARKTGGANKSQNNFLFQHVEKIGLVVAILLGSMFIWKGVSLEKLSSQKSPEELKKKSISVANYVQTPAWDGEEGLSSQRSAPADYPERVEKLQKPILSDSYETVMPFDPPTVGQTTHRSDPNLYAAMDLRATAITGGLAYKKSDDLVDPTADDKPAVIEKKAKKPPKKKKNDTDGFGFGGDDAGGGPPGMAGGEDAGGMGEMMSGMGSGSVRQLSADKLIGFRPGTNKILESGTVVEIRGAGAAASSDGGMAGEGGEMMSGEGMEGAMAGGMEGGMEGGMMNQNVASSSATSIPATIVAVVGVVPFKKQWDEYSRVLQGASGYEASRDQPRYVYLYGQRVDVTDNPDRAINEDEWEAVTQFKEYRKETQKWDGSPRELVDEKYLDPFITYVCPPVMMRDITGMLTHPEIPLRNAPAAVEPAPQEEPDDDPKEAPKDAPGGFVEKPGAGAVAAGGADEAMGAAGGGGMMGGMMGGDMGGMMGGMGGDMGGMMGGMGGMMGGMGGGGAMAGRSIPDYKMVRFFDFNAEPGRIYRYRVRLLLEDPNHPNIKINVDYPQHIAPPLRSLDEDVVARINQLNDAEHDQFFRETEWSDPTAPVSVPDPTQIFAGTTLYQTMSRDQDQRAFMDKEPLGTLKPVVWDSVRGVDIPHNYTVYRGSVLNQTTDIEYAHPVSTVINAVESFDFTTNLFVGDIRGGELLPGSSRDWQVLTPGEFALIDGAGRLIVRNELDDMEMFNRYEFKPPVEEETGGNSMEDMMGGGEEGGMAEMMEQGAGGGR